MHVRGGAAAAPQPRLLTSPHHHPHPPTRQVDNFELAKQQLKLESEGEKRVDAAYQGLYKQMVELFRGMGLEATPGVGAPFDPNLHDAIMREESDDVADGTILEEFRKVGAAGERAAAGSGGASKPAWAGTPRLLVEGCRGAPAAGGARAPAPTRPCRPPRRASPSTASCCGPPW